MRKRTDAQREDDVATFERVSKALARGESLAPDAPGGAESGSPRRGGGKPKKR
jgi:hypothetical protein